MDRPEHLPDDVAAALEELESHELRAASRYAERLAERRERSRRSRGSGQFIFSGNEGVSYYETGGIWGTITWEDDT
jgi:hypothetical protein